MTVSTGMTEAFFLASKRSEIASLRQLMSSCELVTGTSNLIHELQRERGLTNLFLASKGERVGPQRRDQSLASERIAQQFQQQLEQLHSDQSPQAGRARLLNNIAYVLHGLNELPTLRAQIDRHQLSATDCTQVFSQLIEGLLAVIFEAADTSDDPEITRALVAMFNFKQGKEYAGQERAWAVIGLAAGHFEADQLTRIANLIECQTYSFQTFEQFATPDQQQRWQAIGQDEQAQEFFRLRQMISRAEPDTALPPSISEIWYELATHRIDHMQALELQLSEALVKLARQRVQQANKELKKHHDSLQLLASLKQPDGSPLTRLLNDDSPVGGPQSADPVSPDWVRALYGLLKEQSEGLKRMSDELTTARQALAERKTLERARSLLMQQQGLNEAQAYRALQQASMTLNKPVARIAEQVIADAEKLKRPTGCK